MTKIVISGYYGFSNAGDEAMLSALVGSIRQVIPDAEITVITGNCSLTEKNHLVHTVGRMDVVGIIKALWRCKILISGGGSLLQDVTSSRSLYYYLAIIRIALWFHKPVMLYAQGIGPLIRPRARQAVRNVLQKVNLISVRDEASQDELKSIGVTKPVIEVTSDAVLSIKPVDTSKGLKILDVYGIHSDRKKIGISVRNWQGLTNFKSQIAKAADRLQTILPCQVIFIPMQYPDDIAAAEDITAMMDSSAIILKEGYSTEELMSIIGCMDVLLGIRLHALVFAALMEIPETAISYDPKIDRFIHLIGDQLCGDIESVTAEMLVNDLVKKISLGHPAPAVIENVSRLRKLSFHNAQLALSVINGK